MASVNQVSTGIRIPEPIINKIDDAAKQWYTSRSQAIVRIVQEWDQSKVRNLPRFIPNMPDMPVNPVEEKSEETDAVYLGTGPGDDI